MNDPEMEKRVLLAMSGELSAAERPPQEAQLLGSDEAMAYREDVARLLAHVRGHLEASDPAPGAISRILEEARRSRRGVVIPFRQPVVRLVAGAAALALLVGGWFVLTPPVLVSDPVDELHTIVAMVAEQGSMLQNGAGLAEQERIRRLARHLLIVEGFIEESERLELEPLFRESEPTTLQWHNTPASLQERYG